MKHKERFPIGKYVIDIAPTDGAATEIDTRTDAGAGRRAGPAAATAREVERTEIGARLRRLRRDRGWTLADVAARTGLAVSTLSKVERGRMSLAYDKFASLAATLGLDIADLYTDRGAVGSCPQPVITRTGEAQGHRSGPYIYEVLSTGLRGRQMMPVRGHIMARSLDEFDEWQSHPGDEFLYVLAGSIELHIAGAEPIALATGESVYFDSGRPHVYLSTGTGDAEVLTVMLPQFPAGAAGETAATGTEGD
ncbi:helix-turn-helix domain-containing protein [Marinibaculum pumilum]|uniref:Helix-turn-helix domain-containing protein n=1 Tax=Marinibaculum pumilum TaxID=1766165 RepID=A0ABV7L1Z5_9PROT